MDWTLISYETLRWTVVYNFVLFFIWLIAVKRDGGFISEIYLVVMALFLARLWGVYFGIRARDLREVDADQYVAFMSGPWWDVRLVPEAICYLAIGVILSRRFIKSYLFKDPGWVAKSGRRKTDRV